MADVINLNKARKVRARRAAEELAAANRAKFGRSRAEKAVEADATGRAARRLEGHRLDEPPFDPASGGGGRAKR